MTRTTSDKCADGGEDADDEAAAPAGSAPPGWASGAQQRPGEGGAAVAGEAALPSAGSGQSWQDLSAVDRRSSAHGGQRALAPRESQGGHEAACGGQEAARTASSWGAFLGPGAFPGTESAGSAAMTNMSSQPSAGVGKTQVMVSVCHRSLQARSRALVGCHLLSQPPRVHQEQS